MDDAYDPERNRPYGMTAASWLFTGLGGVVLLSTVVTGFDGRYWAVSPGHEVVLAEPSLAKALVDHVQAVAPGSGESLRWLGWFAGALAGGGLVYLGQAMHERSPQAFPLATPVFVAAAAYIALATLLFLLILSQVGAADAQFNQAVVDAMGDDAGELSSQYPDLLIENGRTQLGWILTPLAAIVELALLGIGYLYLRRNDVQAWLGPPHPRLRRVD